MSHSTPTNNDDDDTTDAHSIAARTSGVAAAVARNTRRALTPRSAAIWTANIAFFLVLDTVLTANAVIHGPATEINPVMRAAIHHAGVAGLLAYKTAALGVLAAAWLALHPRSSIIEDLTGTALDARDGWAAIGYVDIFPAAVAAVSIIIVAANTWATLTAAGGV